MYESYRKKREEKKHLDDQTICTNSIGRKSSQGRGRKDITKNKKYLNVSKKNWNSLDSFSSKITENAQMGEQTKEILEN